MNRQTIEIDEEKARTQHKLTIEGLDIYFPHKPYDCQKKYIETLLKSLKKDQNCLLESPTGTGKTLSLLTSITAFIKANP